MADKLKLKVELRKILGRKVKRLRSDGLLPGNVYGKDVKSLAIKIPVKDFEAVFASAGETGIVELTIAKEKKTRPALIHNVHIDPVSSQFLHADFHQVDLTKSVTVDVPIEISGESPAESQGGVLVQLLNEIEVEALPTDLPDKFTVDVTSLEKIGDGITLKNLKVSDKVKLLTDNLDELVIKIEEPTKEEEPEPVVTDEEGEEEGEPEDQEKGEKKERPEAEVKGEVKGEGKEEAKGDKEKPAEDKAKKSRSEKSGQGPTTDKSGKAK